ncbi:hypothetical protein [Stenotrophomonas phage RAS14]
MASFYTVHRTDISAPSIEVPKFSRNTTDLGITLTGKINREYGEELDQAYLNVLENFACPEDSNNPGNPDLSKTSQEQLSRPTIGQLWYNSSKEKIFFWTGTIWTGTANRGEYAANWGRIYSGEQLPKPVNPVTGRVFEYSECIWSVSPAAFLGKPGYLACSTDSDAKVTMRYRYSGTNNIIGNPSDNPEVHGIANFLIIGIPGVVEHDYGVSPPEPSSTSTPTPTPTPSTTPSSTVTPTPTASVTPTTTQSLSPTPTPAPSNSATPAPSSTPTMTPSSTPASTPPVTPSPTPAGRFDWVLTNSWAGQENHGCRPDDLDTGQALDQANAYFQQYPCDMESLGAYYQVNWCDPGSPTSIGVYGWECMII